MSEIKLEVMAMRGRLEELKQERNLLVLSIQDRIKAARSALSMFSLKSIIDVPVEVAARELVEAVNKKVELKKVLSQIESIKSELP